MTADTGAFHTMDTDEALGGNLPLLDLNDPAQLEALFGNFGIWDHYRKSVLADCREIIRAQFVEKGEKVTESRLDDLARLHPHYLDLLAKGLDGRRAREQNVWDSLRGGA
jgi:hypothetical protein